MGHRDAYFSIKSIVLDIRLDINAKFWIFNLSALYVFII